MKKLSIPRNIHFSPAQINLGEKHAKTLGMSFNSWVKYLVIKELELISKSRINAVKSSSDKLDDKNQKNEKDMKDEKKVNENESKEHKAKREIYRMAGLEEYMDEENENNGDGTLPY